MAIDTFGTGFGEVDITSENEEPKLRRQRLIDADAALRPWLIGKALRVCDYTLWDRVKLTVRETWRAARLSWGLTR